MFTASPVTSRSCVPVTTSPVLTPVRRRSETPYARSSSSFSVPSESRSSAAARSARSASSSWTTGTPNAAITASPMNFSNVPPCRSRHALATSKKLAITRRNDSGSSRSPSAVEPVTSAKSTVTVFRTSRPAAPSNLPPQWLQNRAPSGFA